MSKTHEARIAAVLKGLGFREAAFSEDPDENRIETVRPGYAIAPGSDGNLVVMHFCKGQGFRANPAQREENARKIAVMAKALAEAGGDVRVARSGTAITMRGTAQPSVKHNAASGSRGVATQKPMVPAAARGRIRQLLGDGRSIAAASVIAKAANLPQDVKFMECVQYIIKRRDHFDLFEGFAFEVFQNALERVSLDPETLGIARAYFKKQDDLLVL